MKCPKCRKKIDSISYSKTIAIMGVIYKEDGTMMITTDTEETMQETFLCPECYDPIATSQEEAIKMIEKRRR